MMRMSGGENRRFGTLTKSIRIMKSLSLIPWVLRVTESSLSCLPLCTSFIVSMSFSFSEAIFALSSPT